MKNRLTCTTNLLAIKGNPTLKVLAAVFALGSARYSEINRLGIVPKDSDSLYSVLWGLKKQGFLIMRDFEPSDSLKSARGRKPGQYSITPKGRGYLKDCGLDLSTIQITLA